MSLKKVVFVSHCVLNTASKVTELVSNGVTDEEIYRKKFLLKAIEEDIHLIQLPCPEFNLYGAKRWGHAREQFDNPFYRESCKKMLEPIILQVREYVANNDKFEVLGIVGIDGSPSCGINLTYCGDWEGELSSNPNLKGMIDAIYPRNEKGVFMEVLKELLNKNNLQQIEMVSLNDFEKLFTKICL